MAISISWILSSGVIFLKNICIYMKENQRKKSAPPAFQIVIALRDLVLLIQSKKRGKHPWKSVTFSKVAGFRTLFLGTPLGGCFWWVSDLWMGPHFFSNWFGFFIDSKRNLSSSIVCSNNFYVHNFSMK